MTDANSELSEDLLERSTSVADSEDSAGLGFVKISREVDGTPEEAKRYTVDSSAVNAADGDLPSTGSMFTVRTAATPEGEEGPPEQVKGHVEEPGAVKAAGWHLPIGVLKSIAVTAAITEDEDAMLPQAKKGAPVHSSPPKDKDSERERQREERHSANGGKSHKSGASWTSKVKKLAWTLPQQYFRRLKQASKIAMVSYGAWYSRMLEPRLSSSHCRIRIKCACGVHI
jgi:hypothetical protein